MIQSENFVNLLLEHGFNFYTGTPCSYLKPFINYIIENPKVDFLEAVNEGNAVAIASGAWLGGRKSVVMFQNSGLGNAINPLTSLNYIFKIPFLGIVTHRGNPKDTKLDEPQHELMGQITTELLDLVKIPWGYFPQDNDKIKESVEMALDSIKKTNLPYFFVMAKDSVGPYELKKQDIDFKHAQFENQTVVEDIKTDSYPLHTRNEVLKSIKEFYGQKDVLYVLTTGKTGREFFELGDDKSNLYMVGSMGHALSLAIGLAHAVSHKKVCVIDGDGSLLMHMGSLATLGKLQPKNLVHIVLDNSVHDSTGGQRSGSEFVSFTQVAKGCRIKQNYALYSLDFLHSCLNQIEKKNESSFVHIKIKPGSAKNLGRPTITPFEVAQRLQNNL